MTSDSDYVFFWMPDDVHTGWASNWYHAPITVPLTIDGEDITTVLPTTEHWMMLQKALLFKDMQTAHAILEHGSRVSSSLAAEDEQPPPPISHEEMARVQALGRGVRGYNSVIWREHRERIVFEGNMHKFTQNPRLKAKLLQTADRILVEASPEDRIWGVGFDARDALTQKEEWGLNLMGKTLEEVRRRLEESR